MFDHENADFEKGLVTEEPKEVLERIIQYGKKGRSTLIVLSGDVTENYDSILEGWAKRLSFEGIIRSTAVKKYELLSLLSGDVPVEIAVQSLIQSAASRDQMYYLNGFHQMDYSRNGTYMVLDVLISLYQKDLLLAPVVLNIPHMVWRQICYERPELRPSIVYLSQKQSEKEPKPPKQEKLAKMPRPQLGENAPWYTRNLRLLKMEKDGMAELLEGTNCQFGFATMPVSKRLYWKFVLKCDTDYYRFEIPMRMVYVDTFSEENMVVGIVLETQSEELEWEIRARCTGMIENDAEFGRIYFVRPEYIGKNPSAAAAALGGFRRLLETIT